MPAAWVKDLFDLSVHGDLGFQTMATFLAVMVSNSIDAPTDLWNMRMTLS